MDDDFTNLPKHELGRLSDEALVAYMRDARAAGAKSAEDVAFDVLVFRHKKRLRFLLLRKVPENRVDELLQEVFLAGFQGIVSDQEIANFSAWINRVASNTIADFWRGKEGKQLNLDREAARLEDEEGDVPERGVDGDFGAFETWDLIDSLLARLRASHQEIVRLYVLQGDKAKPVCDATGESADNVYQVAKRFRDDLRRLLNGGTIDDNDETGSVS